MKRSVVVLFLALFLLISLPALPAAASGGEDCEIDCLDILGDNAGNWVAQAQVTAPSDCVLALAAYSAEGGMLGFWQTELSGSPDQTQVEIPLVNYGGDGCTAKAFLLRKDTFVPLCRIHLLITAGGVAVRDGSFENVTVSATVGDGDVTLDNVTVTGDLCVKGGGVNSIVIKNNSNVGNVLVRKTAAGGVRLLAEEGARVGVVVVDDGKDDVILEGEFNQVSVATDAPVVLRGADVTGLTVRAESAKVTLGQTRVSAVVLTEEAKNAALNVGNDSSVASLTTRAADAAVSGEGTVAAAFVSGDNTRIDTEGTLVSVKPGTQGVTRQEEPVASAPVSQAHPVRGANAVALAEDFSGAVVSYDGGTKETITLTRVRSAGELAALWTGEGEEAVISDNVLVMPDADLLLSEAARGFFTLDSGTEEEPKDPPVPGSYSALRFAEGSFFIIAPGASVTCDCALELTDCALFAEGQLTVEEPGYLSLSGGYRSEGTAVLVNDGVLTVRGYASCFGAGAALVNNGSLLNLGSLGVYSNGQLVNNGTLLNGLQAEDSWGDLILMGTTVTNSPGAVLLNNGSLGGEYSRSLYTRGENETEESVLLRNEPPRFVNEGLATSAGHIWMNGGTVENAGVFNMDRDSGLDIGPGLSSDWHVVLEEKYLSQLAQGDSEAVFDCTAESVSLIRSSEYRNTAVRDSVWINSGVLTVEDGGSFRFAGSFDNSGTVNNGGGMFLWTADASVLSDVWSYDPAQLDGLEPSASKLNNTGAFNNGPVGTVGENDVPDSYLQFNAVAVHNSGRMTNNGGCDWFGVDYTQTADAVYETYNDRGMNMTACKITVPAGARFHDQGYLTVNDQYGVEPDSDTPDHLSDFSGWANFKEVWQDPNGSRWADYRAQVFSKGGYDRAEAAQKNGADYTRLDFCGDMTLENARFDCFREYWVLDRRFGDEEGDYGWTTLTLTGESAVDCGTTLHISGDNWWNWTSQKMVATGGRVVLEQGATLRLEPGGDWEDGHRDSGRITVWGVGSLDAGNGTILTPWDGEQGEYPGEIEVYDEDFWIHDPETDSERYQGKMEHIGELSGLPEDTIYVADMRLIGDLREAVANDRYRRAAIRRGSVLAVTEDLTLPERLRNLYIEPGSGLTVEEGAKLRLELSGVDNQGDIHVYGAVIQGERCYVENNQYLEIGSLSAAQRGSWEFSGELANRGHIHVYALGDLRAADNGRLTEGWDNISKDEGAVVALGKWHVRESFPALTVAEEAFYQDCVFLGDVTVDLSGAPTESGIEFHNCDFHGGVTVLLPEGDEHWEANLAFGDDCRAGSREALPVTVRAASGSARGRVGINGANGLRIQAKATAWVSSEGGSYSLNGVTCSGEGGCSVLYETDEEGRPRPVFQGDGGQNTERPLTLSGSLTGFAELRLMQGCIDISGLDVASGTEYNVSDMWGDTRLRAGSRSLQLWESEQAPEYGGSFFVEAESGAEIVVHGAFMTWDPEAQEYGFSTNVIVAVGEELYQLDPHIFGAKANSPRVYIGTGDENVKYTLRHGETVYEFRTEYLTDTVTIDGQESERQKTHLGPTEGGDWFTASPDHDPGLELTIALPQGVTVVFDHIPVKPDWNESE